MLRSVARRAFCRALGAVLLAAPWASPSLGEPVPSLANAIYYDDGEIWAGGEPHGNSPVVEARRLTPAPMSGEGFSTSPEEPCNDCPPGQGGRIAGVPVPYNRCGCDQQLFPWFAGPGECDVWCVGPHWNVEADGLFIRREDADWGNVAGVDPVAADQFDYGPGVRLFVTGYNYTNYGLQIGYEGVNDFHALATTATDDVTYESRFNSLEVNVLRRTDVPLKALAGFRYVQLDEDFVAVEQADGDAARTKVSNRLPGFHIGALRDAWQLNRWITIEPYGNVGAYLNDFKREFTDVTGGAYTTEKNELTEIAFIGEAGVTSVLRINRCLALRGGYQVLALDGVGTALDASLAGLAGQPTFDRDTLVYHGVRFGVEYQR